MTYTTGQSAAATDLNTFLETVRNVYGTGSGDRGYGQTNPALAAVAQGASITAQNWSNLRTAIATSANHQGTSIAALMSNPEVGQTIAANEALAQIITAIDENRLTAAPSSMTLTNAAHVLTRSSPWSTSISAVVDVDFPSEDAARYFFNTGGELRLKMSHPNGTGRQDSDWRDVFDRIGVIKFAAQTSTTSGSAGSLAPLGYFDLTNTPITIFDGQNIGGSIDSAYTANDVTIAAVRRNYVGLRGGNGSGIRFTITLTDESAGDSISAGTQVIYDLYKATQHVIGIATPTFNNIQNLDAGGVTDLPGAVSNLVVSSATFNSLTISYTAAPGATRHEYSLDGGAYQQVPSDNVIHGLSPVQTYSIRVRGVNSAGPGVADSTNGTTLAEPTVAPGAVTNLVVTGRSSTTLIVTFTQATNATSHEVALNDSTTYTPIFQNQNGTWTVGNLNPSSTYVLSVRGRNAVGTGAAATASGTTEVAPVTVPGAVTNLRITNSTARTLTLAYTPAANATSHEVSINDGAWSTLAASTLDNLTPSTNYSIRVRGKNTAGTGTHDTTTGQTTGEVPGPVNNLRVISSAETSIVIDFDAAERATGHQYRVNSGTWLAVPSNKTITGLAANTTYSLEVRGVNAAGVGDAAAISASTAMTAPGEVTNLRVTGQTANSITIAFTDAPRASSHQVNLNGAGWQALSSMTISSLASSTNYSIQVRGVNSVGAGPAASTSGATAASPPGAVTSLSVTGATTTSLTVAYSAAPGADYHQYSLDGSNWATLASNTISGLSSSTTYNIYVRGVNSAGAGSQAATQGTTALGVPGGLSVSVHSTTQTGINIEWTAASGASSYQMSINGGAWQGATGAITGLAPSTTYSIQVRGVNAAGAGPAASTSGTTQAVVAGSRVFNAPGQYTFTVPVYTSLSFDVHGAGGGGGASNVDLYAGLPGTAGGDSIASGGNVSMVGYGGAGGQGSNYYAGVNYYPGGAPQAAGGGATGGNAANTQGGGQAGGVDGPYGWTNGQKGGNGGRAQSSYHYTNGPAPGTTITIVVGTGGTGGNRAIYFPTGANGASGYVGISWA